MPRKRRPMKLTTHTKNTKIKQGDIVTLDDSLISLLLLDSAGKPSPRREYSLQGTDLVLCSRENGKNKVVGIMFGQNKSNGVTARVRPSPKDFKPGSDETAPEALEPIQVQIDKQRTGLSDALKEKRRDHFKKPISASGAPTDFFVIAKPLVITSSVPKGSEASLIINKEMVGLVLDECLTTKKAVVDIRTDLLPIVAPTKRRRTRKQREAAELKYLGKCLAMGVLGLGMQDSSTMFLGEADLEHRGFHGIDGKLQLIRLASSRRMQGDNKKAPTGLMSLICQDCSRKAYSLAFSRDRTTHLRHGMNISKCRGCGKNLPNYNKIELKVWGIADGVAWPQGRHIMNLLTSISTTHANLKIAAANGQ